MHFLYIILSYLIIPFLILRLYIKSFKQLAYRHRIKERLAIFTPPKSTVIWIHAVSLGEVIAAAPLIEQMLARHPDKGIVLTTTTPTGSAKALSLFSNRVFHVYSPFDAPLLVNQFLNKLKPQLAIMMETEIWPNWYAACKKRNIPIIIANARLSERSKNGYQRIKYLTKKALNAVEMILVQTKEDGKRFIELGAAKENVQVIGNIKFDLTIPTNIHEQGQQFRTHWGKNRPVWIAGSTHHGEEEIILTAHQKIKETHPDALLILVPRHPERFDKVAEMANQFSTVLRTDLEKTSPEILNKMDVLIGNTIGEMFLYIASSDVSFIGGSLIPQGGHNILEPAALYAPVLTGPNMFNFQKIYDDFIEAEAVITVVDFDSLAQAVTNFFESPISREEYACRGFKIIEKNQGALERHLGVFERYL